MSNNRFSNEPPIIWQLGDYLNEFYFGIQNALWIEGEAAGIQLKRGEDDKDFYARFDDATFRKAISVAQKDPIRTIVERFAVGSKNALTDENGPIVDEWIAASPKRIARMDELVGILNTTDDPTAYKRAYNELPTHIYAEPQKPTFQIIEPATTLRSALGEDVSPEPQALALRP